MKKYPAYIYLAFLLMGFIISCQREINFNIDKSSRGSLAKDGSGNCLPIQVAGTYSAGKNVGDTNFVIVTVDVTKAGGYEIHSDTVNGFSFGATGNFADIGSTTVKLKASGKPIVGGTNFFTMQYDSTVCKAPVTVQFDLSGPASFTLDGGPNTCMTATLAGAFVTGASLDTNEKVRIGITATVAGTYDISTNTVNGYTFSGTGTISNPGPQTIELAASGTPVSPGTDVFTVTAGSSSCTFSVTLVNPVTVTNNDHFPLTAGSHWTYDNTFRAGDSIQRILNSTATINGHVYTVMTQQSVFGGPPNPSTFYFRKAGNDYFEYGLADKYTGAFQFADSMLTELPILKEGLAKGDSWESQEFTGPASFGQVLFLKYIYRCLNANAAATINGVTYSNIYILTVSPMIKSQTDAYGSTSEVTTYYYAKGVGIVYLHSTSNSGFLNAEWLVRPDWLVN